jgi:DNA-binding IclR family transcriptional regulator
MSGNVAVAGASVTSRVLSLLGSFDADHRCLTLTAMARRAGLPVPTAYRLARELTEWGALVRLASGEYMIGQRMWDLGLLAPAASGLRQVAAPFLQDLYASTLATVHLAEREDTHVLYLDRISGRSSVPVVSRIGARLPLHATGVGKVLLAHAPANVRHSVLAGGLARITPYTITRPEQLSDQLRRVRRDGYAHTSEEMSLGACSLAVPVTGPGGEVVASIGVVVGSFRGSLPRLVAALRTAADGIGQRVPAGGFTQ